MSRRKRGLPPSARRTSSGRITITIRTTVDGEVKRLSHSKILPTEPVSYETETEAWEGYARVLKYLEERSEHEETLLAFWQKWTDPEHHWNEERSEPTVISYRSRTAAFVASYGRLPLDALNVGHLDEHMENGGALSHIGAISRILQDAMTHGRAQSNPFAERAAKASRLMNKRASEKRKLNPPPKTPQVELVLQRLTMPCFPPSLRGWFVCATETGFRGGEVDGMEWEFLEGNRYSLRYQWNAKVNKRTTCKHGSSRDMYLTPRVMDAIDAQPRTGRYIWTDSSRDHWTHNTRDYWWGWSNDGQPSPRQLSGGKTMYNSTRHYFATRAVNEMGLTPYETSLLLGHSDGGKLVTDVYAEPDRERAMRHLLDHAITPPTDLNSRRRDDDEAAAA